MQGDPRHTAVTAAPAPDGDPLDEAVLPGPDHIADRWLHRIVSDTGCLSRPGTELREQLQLLGKRLRAALVVSRHDAEAGRDVGHALVEAHLVDPAVLESTQAELGLLFAAAADSTGRVRRLGAVLGAVGHGYAQALRVRALVEHEEITRAALTARRRADEARWASEARFSTLFNASTVGIAVFGPDGSSLDTNRAASELVGLPVHELRRMRVSDFVSRERYPEFWAGLGELVDGTVGRVDHQQEYRRPDGETIWVDVVVSVVRRPDGQVRYLLAIVQDVTERMRLQQRLRHQAGHDPLTELPNRSLFYEALHRAIADVTEDGARPGVCYLDLDGFKVVNDTLGHETGDELLQRLAERLREALDPHGHLVARMGGDEFVVLVERSPDRAALEEVAQLALRTVQQPVQIREHDIAISASVGVVRHEPGSGPGELMKAADTTLYSAKHDGRGRYAVFDRERHRSDVLRFELSAQMPDALKNDRFVVTYQPLVRLTDERMIGVEALVRWLRPDGELLGPDRFIPLAEETGLVVPLGRHVLDEACRQARKWRDADPEHPLIVSVNVAARQVAAELDLAAEVEEVLAQHDLPPGLLQLELTERELMGASDRPATALREIADMGVRIAIDDFGTGYSNLAYLRQLPVHHLKLAGSFVSGGADRDDVILRALVRLARSLDLDVTAEAVETREQADRLRSYGCTNAQGWYYAPAVPAERIPGLVRHPFVR